MSECQVDSQFSSSGWKEKYETLLNYHQEVENLIEESERLSDGQKDEALKLYIRALSLIDAALAEPLICPENPDLSWERAGVMVEKLKKSKKDLMSRVANLQTKERKRRAADDAPADPPSYEEAMGLPSTSRSEASEAKAQKTLNDRSVIIHVPRTYRELAEALQQLEVRQWQDGTQALFPTDMTNV